MRLNRIGSTLNRNERNNLNENFDVIEQGFSQVLGDSSEAKEIAEGIDGKASQALATANGADNKSTQALATSDGAMTLAESVRTQFDQIVIEGDSSVEAAQARVSADDTVYSTLKARLDAEKVQVTQQLAQVTKVIYTALTTQSEIQDLFSAGGRFKLIGNVMQLDLPFRCPDDNYPCAFIVYSNTYIEFSESLSFELKAHNTTRYKIFSCTNVENVTILNAKLDGKRDLNTSTTGEWGMGIGIRGSKNIHIENAFIENCWGDAIYIGSSALQNFSENVTLKNIETNNNRRQSISIISVKTLRINEVLLKNTNGTAPSDGIDIEPNFNTEFLQDIVIENVTTINNAGAGLKVYLNAYNGSLNEISITVKKHVDKNSSYSCRIVSPNDADFKVKGIIRFDDCVWENNERTAFTVINHNADSVRIELNRPKVIWGGEIVNNIFGYYIGAGVNTTNEFEVGNVHLIEPSLEVLSGANIPQRAIYFRGLNSEGTRNDYGLKDISIINPTKLAASLEDAELSIDNKVDLLRLEDRYDVLKKSVISNLTLNNFRTKATYDNEGANSPITLNLSALHSGLIVTVKNKTGQRITLSPGSNKLFLPYAKTITSVISNSKGDAITFIVKSDSYEVLSYVGNWIFDNNEQLVYEKGIWTPVLNVTGALYSGVSATYTRVGNRVHVSGILKLTSKGTSSVGLAIAGLPFAENGTEYSQLINVTVTNKTAETLLVGVVNATSIELRAYHDMAYQYLTLLSDTSVIRFNGSYMKN